MRSVFDLCQICDDSGLCPRLRRRRQVELTLAADAEARGWKREVERHQATAARLERLLVDSENPFEGPTAEAASVPVDESP